MLSNMFNTAVLNTFSPLNSDDLKKMAPSVFTESQKSNLSDRYEFVPTSDIVNFMEENGWFPIDAKEIKTRKQENKGFQKHIVRFRHPELSFNEINGDGNFIDILLTNSHDGMSSFTFQIGIFRLVCSNGLVVKQADFGTVRVRHLSKESSEVFNAQLLEAISTLVNQIPKTVAAIDVMQSTMLNEQQIAEFALKAATIRFQEKIKNMDQQQLVKEIINAERQQDHGNTIWVVANRIQEKLTKGNFFYVNNNGKSRKARTIKNFTQDVKFNSQFWGLIEETII